MHAKIIIHGPNVVVDGKICPQSKDLIVVIAPQDFPHEQYREFDYRKA